MKHTITLFLLTFSLCTGVLHAQVHENPFAEFGDSSKILTLSNGKYVEVFDLDSVVQIGNGLYHVYNHELIGFVEPDTSFNEYTLRPEVASRWLSPDPLAAKYPSMSPYNFVNNSPILYIDPDGLEPARNQAGTIQDAILQWKELGLTTAAQIRNWTTNKGAGAIRYVYTKDRGWIDLQHFFGTLTYSKMGMDLLEPISGSSLAQRTLLGPGANNSYFSYEDKPTNKFAEDSRASLVRKVPIEGGPAPQIPAGGTSSTTLKLKTGEDLYNSVENVFTLAESTHPVDAPNWTKIPYDDQDRIRLPKGSSFDLLQTGSYIPQNHTSKPLNLSNFPAASSSIERDNPVPLRQSVQLKDEHDTGVYISPLDEE